MIAIRDRQTQSTHRRPARILLVLLMITGSGAYFQEPTEEVLKQDLEAFLSTKGVEAFDIVVRNPNLLKSRAAQVKVYRSQRSKAPEILAAAYRLCFEVPGLEATAPMIHRRCNGAFIGSKPAHQRLLLEAALENSDLRKDLRFVGLISTVLHSQDEGLQQLGKMMVERYPDLKAQPAIREALGEGTLGIPDYESFKKTVNPIFSSTGSDGRACVNCHNSRPVLFLPVAGPNEDDEPVTQQRYLSVLRVIDLENPAASLILNKPTHPMSEDPKGASRPDHHTGGVRFEKGDETYSQILGWIQSAQN